MDKLNNSFTRKRTILAKSELLDYDLLSCPRCKEHLKIQEMLDAASCFYIGAIMFDCKHCNASAYFSPYESFIGAAINIPDDSRDIYLVDYKFRYLENFQMSSEIKEDVLNINIGANSWHIKSSSQIK